jgi:hypothetical protein
MEQQKPSETDKLLKSVIETLIKKETPKFKSLIQKELATRIHAKLEELKKALSGGSLGVTEPIKQPIGENLPGAPTAPPATDPNATAQGDQPAPAPLKPIKPKDVKIVPTTAGAAKDDMSLDPNFEKEFYHSNEKYKNQEVLIKQLGTGFGKPVRVYINGRRWEFFPGPKAAMKATRAYIDGMMKDVRKDPEMAASMTQQIKNDKKGGVASVPAPVDAGKPNEVADAELKKKELVKGKPPEGKAPPKPAAKKK